MTSAEIVHEQMESAGYQLSQVLAGLDVRWLDLKPVASMMSLREQVEHLCEVYVAAEKAARSEKHEWGAYQSGAATWEDLTNLMWTLRAAATESLLHHNLFHEASAYIVEHDNYHVGQMAAIRIAVDPAWNPYALYR